MRPFSYLLIPAPSLLILIFGQLVGASLWQLSSVLKLLPQMVGGMSQTQCRSLIGTCEVQCPVGWLNFPGLDSRFSVKAEFGKSMPCCELKEEIHDNCVVVWVE